MKLSDATIDGLHLVGHGLLLVLIGLAIVAAAAVASYRHERRWR